MSGRNADGLSHTGLSAASTHRNVKAKISVQGFHSSGLIIGFIDSEKASHPRSSTGFKFVSVELRWLIRSQNTRILFDDVLTESMVLH